MTSQVGLCVCVCERERECVWGGGGGSGGGGLMEGTVCQLAAIECAMRCGHCKKCKHFILLAYIFGSIQLKVLFCVLSGWLKG